MLLIFHVAILMVVLLYYVLALVSTWIKKIILYETMNAKQ